VEWPERIEVESMPMKTIDGRDELNLAEFPLCALAHRRKPNQRTLHFEDRIWDELRREMITRQLTITGSDAFGLPTALDDEVLLGLVQLTKQHGFSDRKVPFSRYQLLKLLGWRDDTKSYERLEASLNRWTGVTLYYRNAWWNKSRQSWVDEKFHVLDNVWLCHRSDLKTDFGEGTFISAFVWNDVIFRSFQAGNLKSLDFDFVKDLDSAIAKRLYRLLDKRFFHRTRWEFGLKDFAYEHIGLSRGYDASSLKRKLRPGIAELEMKGFLQPMAENQRFRKLCATEWRVIFTKAMPKLVTSDLASPPSSNDNLVTALIQRGVTRRSAQHAVQEFPADQIEQQIEVFDWLISRKDVKVSRNPPGWLMSAITDNYSPPKDFVSRVEQARRDECAAETKRQGEEREKQREAMERHREEKREQRIMDFLQSLGDDERMQLEKDALVQAPKLQRSLIQRGGSLGAAARKAVIDAYVLARLLARQ